MSVLTSLIPTLLFGAAGQLFKKKKQPARVPVRQRNTAAEAAQKNDRLAKRRGAFANQLTGRGGAESKTGGGKTSLGT